MVHNIENCVQAVGNYFLTDQAFYNAIIISQIVLYTSAILGLIIFTTILVKLHKSNETLYLSGRFKMSNMLLSLLAELAGAIGYTVFTV